LKVIKATIIIKRPSDTFVIHGMPNIATPNISKIDLRLAIYGMPNVDFRLAICGMLAYDILDAKCRYLFGIPYIAKYRRSVVFFGSTSDIWTTEQKSVLILEH